jgi:hypothetical protein
VHVQYELVTVIGLDEDDFYLGIAAWIDARDSPSPFLHADDVADLEIACIHAVLSHELRLAAADGADVPRTG